MKKSILIPIIAVGILAVVAGAAVGMYYTFTPTAESEIVVLNVQAVDQTDEITVTLTCEENQTQLQAGQTHRHQRKYAYMHKIQFKNGSDGEVLMEQQYQHRWRHRIQNGNTYMYQFHVEGIENGQQLQLRIEYNNGKVVTYNFTV